MNGLEMQAEIERLKKVVRKEFDNVESLLWKNHCLNLKLEVMKKALEEIANTVNDGEAGLDSELEHLQIRADNSHYFKTLAKIALNSARNTADKKD